VLDPKTAALARLAAALGLQAAPASYRGIVRDALAAGATVDEVIDTMRVIAATIGLASVVAAAPLPGPPHRP
jgi:alkylhydroperoxidase/carboxymuconolactone decarboxylase family protein YurZ